MGKKVMLITLRNALRLMISVCLLFEVGFAHAAAPAALNYQGFLTNPGTGAPLTTPVGVPLVVTFKLWDAVTAGNLVYAEHQAVTVTNGVFNVQIGSGIVETPPSVVFTGVTFDIPYWLEVTVLGETLSPRQALASAPYALGARVTSNGTTLNTAMGTGALHSNTVGQNNTASGYSALYANSTGNGNTAHGNFALQANTTGLGNTANGFFALASNTTGQYNTASGDVALYSNTTGGFNQAIGYAALYFNVTGNNNIALGQGAGYNITGSNNIDIGNVGVAGESSTIRIGDSSQTRTFLSGVRGVVTGNADAIPVVIDSAGQLGSVTGCASGQVMQYNGTTWACATAVGPPGPPGPSGLNTVPGTGGTTNTAIGYVAMQSNTTGSANTAIGNYALAANTTGVNNTAGGWGALSSNTIGWSNTAYGAAALEFNTTADFNTAVGVNALSMQNFTNANVEWSSFNTAVGYQALHSNNPTSTSNGLQNTAVGGQALQANTIGYNNTAVGMTAMQINTSGSFNAAFGVAAMQNATGSNNTAIGVQAGMNWTGNGNTAVGNLAGYSLTTGNYNIDIGNQGVAGDSGIIRIGDGGATQTATYLSGAVYGTSFNAKSDRDAKENFSAINAREILDKVAALPITRWNFKTEAATAHLGPMAQDFYAAFQVGPDDKHIATVDESGVALAAIQGLNAKLESLVQAQAEKIAALEKRQDLQARNAEVGQLRAQVAELQRTVKVLLSRTAPDGELALLH